MAIRSSQNYFRQIYLRNSHLRWPWGNYFQKVLIRSILAAGIEQNVWSTQSTSPFWLIPPLTHTLEPYVMVHTHLILILMVLCGGELRRLCILLFHFLTDLYLDCHVWWIILYIRIISLADNVTRVLRVSGILKKGVYLVSVTLLALNPVPRVIN